MQANDTYNDTEMQHLHDVMLMMLKDFMRICHEHNLTYYASFGTVIGALRHKGFIPWDDDIDICMPAHDLQRLTQIVQENHADTYEMIDFHLNENYPMATSRMMLRGTQFRDEALLGMEFDSGIFLDLFPLYNLADDEQQREKQIRSAWFWNKLAMVQLVPHPYIAGSGLATSLLRAATRIAHGILRILPISHRTFNARAQKALLRCEGIETERVGFPCDTNSHWILYTRDELEPARLVAFEDTTIAIPHKSEELLTRIYGDFMTPPPLEARSAHRPVVLDFGAYTTLDRES